MRVALGIAREPTPQCWVTDPSAPASQSFHKQGLRKSHVCCVAVNPNSSSNDYAKGRWVEKKACQAASEPTWSERPCGGARLQISLVTLLFLPSTFHPFGLPVWHMSFFEFEDYFLKMFPVHRSQTAPRMTRTLPAPWQKPLHLDPLSSPCRVVCPPSCHQFAFEGRSQTPWVLTCPWHVHLFTAPFHISCSDGVHFSFVLGWTPDSENQLLICSAT